jgi:hypothetical protein
LIHPSEPTLRLAIATAFERTGTEPYNIDGMIRDIYSEFPKLDEAQIKKAIRNGGLGVYGKTFKLTTQEVCIWIRNYHNEIRFRAPWE